MTLNNIKDGWVKIELELTSKDVIITIEDNANGVPEEILHKIFDPYYTTKHQSQGTGLGLHMSKDIIENHLKGKLIVRNTTNGVKFFIRLPLNI